MNINKKYETNSDKQKSMQLQSGTTRGRRYSLATIISSAFFGIVFLFMITIILSYYRLISFQSIISHITEDSFPEIAHSRNIYNQTNELLYLGNVLSNTRNHAALRITKQQVDNKVQSIKKQIVEKGSDVYLQTQLKVVNNQFIDLYALVKQKLQIQEQLMSGQNSMYDLHEKMFKLSQKNRKTVNNNSANTAWTLAYSDVVTLTSQTLIKIRLQQVRHAFQQINSKIDLLNKDLVALPQENQQRAKSLALQLQQLLLAKDGLLLLKIQQLRIAGRVIGRSNFIKSLVDDFSRQAEFKSYQINESVIDNSNSLIERAATETKLMGIASILVLFVLFSAIYFIKKRFVERIVTLNNNVMARLNGDNIILDVRGNDEISDIAQAVNFFAEKIEKQNKVLHALSLTDGLTGLPNRRALDQRLSYDLLTATRNKWPVIVMLMDLDYFKQYNDTYGHLAGDDCLKKVAAALLHCKKRSTDFVARYGGEEFMFILPNTCTDGAQKIADAILTEIRALNILHQTSSCASQVTMSIGMASFHHQDDADNEALIKKADSALYQAKKSGKNCVCYYH